MRLKTNSVPILWSLAYIFLALGCSKEEVEREDSNGSYNWENHVPFDVDYEGHITPENTAYQSDPVVLGPLLLEESSGVAASVNNSGMLWTHEDGGNGNFIYLVDGTTAEILCTYRITGASNTDWEDMEVVADPETNKSYIYIADTGDNDERRSTSIIFRLEEPVYTENDKGKTVQTASSALESYPFRYIGGSKDVESMFVDRDSKDVYLVTKRDERSRLYIIPAPSMSSSNRAYHVGNLGFKEASAATANHNGSKFIVRNRQYLFYWERQNGEKIWEVFKRTPQRLPYFGEVQGEAVCFDAQDNYYTTSEKGDRPADPPVYKYLRK